ncbi:MAG: hypothetical protein ACTSX9_01755 [Candidatus Njordarchaeales archaeon]
MSRVRPKVIKDTAKRIVVNYWDVVRDIWEKSEELSADPKLAANYRFQMYKKLVELTTDIKSKSVRNRVAGYIITLVKQILYLGRFTIEELATKYKLKEAKFAQMESIGEELEEEESGKEE